MSSHLWRAYFENDLEKFRSLLGLSEDRTGGTNEYTTGSLTNESPFDLSSPPRKQSTFTGYNAIPSAEPKAIALNRFQINSRLPANIIANPLAPATGLTLLHHAATANKLDFVEALLNHPQTDLFLQDFESGWTALHRALYFGNISVAKQIMSKNDGIGLVKIKDREGNSPFELFESTIKVEATKHGVKPDTIDEFDFDDSSDGGSTELEELDLEVGEFKGEYLGDETFIWGSNKNASLGFSDGDDRQFPERMPIPRPSPGGSQDALVTLAPTYVKDVQLAKFHSAMITTASSNNLYVCGHGQSGRLGLGHESTEFTFKRVQLPRRVRTVALGQDHTVAVLENGDVFTWGTGRYGQLGYPANIDKNDKEEYQLIPRQVFTNLRKERIIGAAASKHHSVVHTIDSIFVFGKNEGQLGLIDADSRTLESQTSPRKVAAAALTEQPISMITATDKATAILLENHDVWVLMNFGIMKLTFPFERFPNTGIKPTRPISKYQSRPNFITKISSGGNTVAALARMGDVFTINVEKSTATTTRTLPVPQRIWSLRKRHMAVRDVDVGQEGAVIICTESGSVWQRTRRSKVKEIQSSGGASSAAPSAPQFLDRAKDYKFSRVPGLAHIAGVRSNAFGSFAAIRRDVDILKTQLEVREPTLWDDLGSLLSFHDDLSQATGDKDSVEETPKLDLNNLRERAMDWFLQKDFISVLKETIHEMDLTEYDTVIRSTELDDLGISVPAHSFMLTGRCSQLRSLFAKAMESRSVRHEGIVELHHQPGGTFDLTFKGISWFSLLIFIFYLYKDVIVTVWTKFNKNKEQMLLSQRVRTDLGLLANQLGLKQLAAVTSGLYSTKLTLDADFEEALADPFFSATGDMLLELKDDTVQVHSSLLCARCSFFDALYHGGSGRWLATRKGEEEYAADQLIRVDMKHVTFETMDIVLKFLYSDKSLHLFDSAKTTEDGSDAFIDLVIGVLSVANELMLDRLVEICQRVIGRFINTQNATSILAAISESSVSTFKDVCLEYIFRNLDTMMETRALDEFDEDLMAELDEAVKERQLAYMPFSRSGRAEAELLEKHPHLAASAESEQQALVQLLEGGPINTSVTEADLTGSPASYRQSSSFRAGSYEKQRRRRSSKSGQERPPTKTPPLLPVQGSELIFDMDDEDPSSKSRKTPISQSPALNRNSSYGLGTTPKMDVWYDCKGKRIDKEGTPASPNQGGPSSQATLNGASPKNWSQGFGIQSSKLDMREIMTQASKHRTSNLSLGLSASIDTAAVSELPASNFTVQITTKVSRKERKRQQQLQAQQAASCPAPAPVSTPDKSITTPKASPWKAVRSPSNPLSLQQPPPPSPSLTPRKDNAPNKLLDVFQTPPPAQSPLSLNTPPKQVMSPRGTQFGQPKHNLPTPPPQVHTLRYSSSGNVISTGLSKSVSSPTQPRSERYDDFPPLSGRLEHVQLPLAEIIQQEQTQQDIIKGKGPKQSLQEIQQEQEFMDWWEKESERYQQEEYERQLMQQNQKAVGVNRGRGRGGGARGGRTNIRGRGGKAAQGEQKPQHGKDAPVTAKRGGSEGGVIRGRKRGRGKQSQEVNVRAEASTKLV